LAFGLFALAEASFGHSMIAGYEQPVFMGILGVAMLFELVWYTVHRTNAIASMAASNPLPKSPGRLFTLPTRQGSPWHCWAKMPPTRNQLVVATQHRYRVKRVTPAPPTWGALSA
jgi:hypothetical protein